MTYTRIWRAWELAVAILNYLPFNWHIILRAPWVIINELLNFTALLPNEWLNFIAKIYTGHLSNYELQIHVFLTKHDYQPPCVSHLKISLLPINNPARFYWSHPNVCAALKDILIYPRRVLLIISKKRSPTKKTTHKEAAVTPKNNNIKQLIWILISELACRG